MATRNLCQSPGGRILSSRKCFCNVWGTAKLLSGSYSLSYHIKTLNDVTEIGHYGLELQVDTAFSFIYFLFNSLVSNIHARNKPFYCLPSLALDCQVPCAFGCLNCKIHNIVHDVGKGSFVPPSQPSASPKPDSSEAVGLCPKWKWIG